jgi:hypothetical protein
MHNSPLDEEHSNRTKNQGHDDYNGNGGGQLLLVPLKKAFHMHPTPSHQIPDEP